MRQINRYIHELQVHKHKKIDILSNVPTCMALHKQET